jgi:putative methionine-R-sulfoxide reductase with GAF domain
MQILDQIRAGVNEAGERASRAQRIADLIRQGGGYRWVGLYDVRREEVAIVAWSGPGPPAHPRFPADQG